MFNLFSKRLSTFWKAAVVLLFFLFVAGCQILSPTPLPQPTQNTPEITFTSQGTQAPPLTDSTAAIQATDSNVIPTLPDIVDNTPQSPADTPDLSSSPVPGQTLSPTPYVAPSATSRPSATPKISATPTPPTAFLRILRPGPYSKINSPLEIEAGVSPGDNGLVLVDLIGEDGRTIARQRLDYTEFIGRTIGIAPKLDFKIAAVAETTRLVISVDDRFGRKIALTSTELVLISIGDNQIYPPGYQYAPYVINAPVEDQIITGSVLKISGLARPVNLTPLIFELIDEKGVVIRAAQLQVPLPGGEQSHMPFELEIPYQVSSPTRVRLTVRQTSDDRIPGNVALWSVPIYLQP
jgi:hypothetical protein